MTADRWKPATDEELAALDALGNDGVWRFDGIDHALSNLDKVLFPARGQGRELTKRDLIRHHAMLAPYELPYLKDRPVNLRRFPDGVDQGGFWTKAHPTGAPDWLTRWRNPVADKDQTEWYTVVDRPAALVFLANLGAVELHPWTSAGEAPEHPTWAYIDIDPGPRNDFDDVLTITGLYRDALAVLGMRSGPKISGSRGIHIWVPVDPVVTFAETRGWVEALSRAVGALVPELVSWKWRIADRGGLARLDYTQNAINRTLVAPFSPRARPGAPVSVPLDWDEIDGDLTPDRYDIDSVVERLATHGDPLADLIGVTQHLVDIDIDELAGRLAGDDPVRGGSRGEVPGQSNRRKERSMPGQDPGPSVKNPEQYEALRDQGASKEKAARIANASAAEGSSKVSRRGGRRGPYEDRTKDDLMERAREIGIEGRSKMNKSELIDALRNH